MKYAGYNTGHQQTQVFSKDTLGSIITILIQLIISAHNDCMAYIVVYIIIIVMYVTNYHNNF